MSKNLDGSNDILQIHKMTIESQTNSVAHFDLSRYDLTEKSIDELIFLLKSSDNALRQVNLSSVTITKSLADKLAQGLKGPAYILRTNNTYPAEFTEEYPWRHNPIRITLTNDTDPYLISKLEPLSTIELNFIHPNHILFTDDCPLTSSIALSEDETDSINLAGYETDTND